MIEKDVLDFLNTRLDVDVWMEIPKSTDMPDEFVVLEKTGSGEYNHISSATFAIQSYAKSMYDAASLNETVKAAMEHATDVAQISRVTLNSDYNFTDTVTKNYRYQAVYDIVYHS